MSSHMALFIVDKIKHVRLRGPFLSKDNIEQIKRPLQLTYNPQDNLKNYELLPCT